LKKIIKIYRIK